MHRLKWRLWKIGCEKQEDREFKLSVFVVSFVTYYWTL